MKEVKFDSLESLHEFFLNNVIQRDEIYYLGPDSCLSKGNYVIIYEERDPRQGCIV